MKPYKRRNYFIDRKFQTKYILLTLLLLVTYTLLFVVILFAPHLLSVASDLPPAEQLKAARSLLMLHKSVWPVIGIVITIMSVLSIFISHKVAGPAYRLNKSLGEIARGDLSRTVTLREGDDLQEVATNVNLLVEELRSFVLALQKDHDLLSEYILELESQIATDRINPTSGREMIVRFKERRESIRKSLDKFSTRN